MPKATRHGVWAVAYAADDQAASDMTARLIRDMGYVGALAESARWTLGGVLYPRMFTPAGMRAALEGALR